MGKTWTVGKASAPCDGPTPDYSSIAAAINAAAAGDEIDICPTLYPEQLTITKALTLRGIGGQGVGRALIQPAVLVPGSLGNIAVITVMNTSGVTIQNLAIDAGNNTVSGCTVLLAGIHFYDASGTVDSVAISGTHFTNFQSCTSFLPGNGFGVQADEDSTTKAILPITVRNTSIHDFGNHAILVIGSGEVVDIQNNSIVGTGPTTGMNQFGMYLVNGVTGQVIGNYITQGTCGPIDLDDCFNLRSEGVALRNVGDGVVVEGNTISNVQAGCSYSARPIYGSSIM